MDTSNPALRKTTIGDLWPWAGETFRHTEQVAASIPEDKLDWRPTDPSGRWSFSLGEIAMHCADIRLMFARQLRGEDSEELYWLASPPERGGSWTRKREPGGLQEIMDTLVQGRTEIETWLALPASELLSPTPGMTAHFEARLTELRAAGRDTAAAERWGPGSIHWILMTVCCHEAGHRGALQANLRLLGISVAEEE